MATHLTDMEELIARINRPNARDYMSEALRCYQAGAFRACVVLTYIALFDDLRDKLAPLAKVNKTAKKIHMDVEKKAKVQEVYETFLSDQLAAANLIDAGQKVKLDMIIKLRNKAAHPSGIHASAEEARHVFFETIDKFLSDPQLQTTYAADSIILALPKGNFFPSNQISDIRDVVEFEIATLHEQAIPYLIYKLVEAREEGAALAKAPAGSFLLGLASLKRDEVREEIRKQIVIAKGKESDYATLIVSLLRVDPKLASDLKAMQRKRIIALLKSVITSKKALGKVSRLAHPLGWLDVFTEENGQDATWEDYQAVVTALVDKYLYDPDLMEIVYESGPIRDAYLEEFEACAGSSQFDIANPAAKAVSTLDEVLGESFSLEQAFRIIAAVTTAAENNAFDALNLISSNFGAVPTLRQRAAKFGSGSSSKAKKILKEFVVSASLKEVLETLGD